MDLVITKVQKLTVQVMVLLLVVVVLLSTGHLGLLIAEEAWKPPRFFIPVTGLLEIFGLFSAGSDRSGAARDTQAYVNKDAIHVSVVLEVAVIAMEQGDH